MTPPADALDLTVCDREPIHVSGAIQPHGLLLVARAATLEIVGGAGDLAGRLNPNWESMPLPLLLGQQVDVAATQAEGMTGGSVLLASVPGRREAFDANLFRSGDHVIVELEPRRKQSTSAGAMLSRLDVMSGAFERSADLRQLCERAAIAFRELTGFDRVMVYQFLDDAAGVVVGEDRAPGLGTFLNHHFPASDIPKQARALYVRNRVRVIPDVDYEPAPIVGQEPGLAGIDLSDSVLRSVSPIHVQYLRNMGVAASASVSIVRDGLLWGLIACHNHVPRTLPQETRTACRALAGGLARQIRAREEAEAYRERIRLHAAEDRVLPSLDQARTLVEGLGERADQLRTMLDADGFVAICGGETVVSGACPGADDLRELVRWLGQQGSAEPFATHILERRFAKAVQLRATASGLLAVSLPTEVSVHLLWFRAEEPQTVEWAGNPHKNAPGPDGMLNPRTSFSAWSEELRGQARRWTRGEVEAASRLRRAMLDIRQRHRLRELNHELAELVSQKEGLLQEKDHLLREVNHRVQNSLQLVQAFLALQARSEESEVVRTHLDEAQRRLSAVALVHRRLYQADQVDTVDLGRYLEELIAEMRISMGDEWKGAMTIDLAPVLISADRAVNVGLILTELVINANKYAYGGGSGPVAITLEPYRNQFRLIVADQGTGPMREHKGFGTRMINAMVQRLGGAIERGDNTPGLRVIVSAPIEPA